MTEFVELDVRPVLRAGGADEGAGFLLADHRDLSLGPGALRVEADPRRRADLAAQGLGDPAAVPIVPATGPGAIDVWDCELVQLRVRLLVVAPKAG